MDIWILYGSWDWNEFSEVHYSEAAANDSARVHFGIPSDVSDADLNSAISDEYESGDWKAFSIDKHTLTLPTESA